MTRIGDGLTTSRVASSRTAPGFSLVELLVALALLGLLAALSLPQASEVRARQRLEAAARRVAQGIERARAEAEELGQPCGLSLGAAGWLPPVAGGLDSCGTAVMPVEDTAGQGGTGGRVLVRHNLPPTLRFTSNGLALDGGTVVVSASGTTLRRCLVMALPLGLVRVGRYDGADAGVPDSEACRPDPAL